MNNPHKGRTGLDRLRHAVGYSIDGLRNAYLGERAFRQEVWCAVPLLALAFGLRRNWVELSLLLGSVLLVLIVELLNSAVETAIDRVSLEAHELSKRAKDLASAAVFLSLVLCSVVWRTALWQRF